MLIGYARVSKADGSQSLDLQRDDLRSEGIDEAATSTTTSLPACATTCQDSTAACALRKGDVPMVWKLDLLKHPEGALCLGFGAGWRRTT